MKKREVILSDLLRAALPHFGHPILTSLQRIAKGKRPWCFFQDATIVTEDFHRFGSDSSNESPPSPVGLQSPSGQQRRFGFGAGLLVI
jgi:hypothetical protein